MMRTQSSAVLQQPITVCHGVDFPRRERLEGSPGAPGSRNGNTKRGFRAGSSRPATLARWATLACDRICRGLGGSAPPRDLEIVAPDRAEAREPLAALARVGKGSLLGSLYARRWDARGPPPAPPGDVVEADPPAGRVARRHGRHHGRRQPEAQVREDAREEAAPARVRSCVEIKSQAPHAIDATSSP